MIEVREAPMPVFWTWNKGDSVKTNPSIDGHIWWWDEMQTKRGVTNLLTKDYRSMTVELSNGQKIIVRAKK